MDQSRRSRDNNFFLLRTSRGTTQPFYTLLGKTEIHVSFFFFCQVHGSNFAKIGAKIAGNPKIGQKLHIHVFTS